MIQEEFNLRGTQSTTHHHSTWKLFQFIWIFWVQKVMSCKLRMNNFSGMCVHASAATQLKKETWFKCILRLDNNYDKCKHSFWHLLKFFPLRPSTGSKHNTHFSKWESKCWSHIQATGLPLERTNLRRVAEGGPWKIQTTKIWHDDCSKLYKWHVICFTCMLSHIGLKPELGWFTCCSLPNGLYLGHIPTG